MIKHLVLMKIRKGVPPFQVEAMVAALKRLPVEVPGVKNWVIGKNFNPDDPNNPYYDNYDYAKASEFDDRASLENYVFHPYHNLIRRNQTRPTLAAVSIADFEF